MAINTLFITAASRDLENGICVLNGQGVIEWANDRFGQLMHMEARAMHGNCFPDDFEGPQRSVRDSEKLKTGIENGMGVSGVKQTFLAQDGIETGLYVNIIPISPTVTLSGPEKFMVYVKELEPETGQTATISQRHHFLFQEQMKSVNSGESFG